MSFLGLLFYYNTSDSNQLPCTNALHIVIIVQFSPIIICGVSSMKWFVRTSSSLYLSYPQTLERLTMKNHYLGITLTVVLLFFLISAASAADCGDGICENTEWENCLVCTADCTCGVCGDGVVDFLNGDLVIEQCDDGNTVNGDGCLSDCLIEIGYACTGQPSVCYQTVCGDGVVEGLELCDDGNTADGDGCNHLCTLETHYICTGQPSVCTMTFCGDGIIVGDQCDDGNAADGDGCSSFCTIEEGWDCDGEPSICELMQLCGNGITEGSEGCDDGNTAAGDGCGADCSIESGYTCSGSPSECQLTSSDIVDYSATVVGGQNTVIQLSNGGFGSLSRGGSKTITNSVTLSNIGDASAKVEARFIDTLDGITFGLISGGVEVIPANNFRLGLAEFLVPLSESGTNVEVVTAPVGLTYLDAELTIPATQMSGIYTGSIVLTFSNI